MIDHFRKEGSGIQLWVLEMKNITWWMSCA